MPLHVKLDPSRALVLVIDVQERLCPAMPADGLARLVKYTQALLGGARELGMPVLCTEQYPKGLGATLPAIRELLASPPIAKMAFSCRGEPAFNAALEATLRRQVLV